MPGGLPASLSQRLGRSDLRRVEGAGSTAPSVTKMGQGRVYGAGGTAVGLSATSSVGSATGGFQLDTGTISVGMIAGIVIGLGAFYLWTRSSQS